MRSRRYRQNGIAIVFGSTSSGDVVGGGGVVFWVRMLQEEVLLVVATARGELSWVPLVSGVVLMVVAVAVAAATTRGSSHAARQIPTEAPALPLSAAPWLLWPKHAAPSILHTQACARMIRLTTGFAIPGQG